MKDIRAYLEISVEKELPKEAKQTYFTGTGEAFWTGKKWTMEMYDRETDSYYETLAQPRWWLKDFSLPELMEEFAAWKDRTYYRCDQNSYCFLYETNIINAKKFTYKELTEMFLTQKGIL